MSTATQDLTPQTSAPPSHRSPATNSAAETQESKLLFAVSAAVVTPLVFVAALLVTWSTGGGHAALLATVPAVFAAGFFGALYWLAGALERDGRVAVQPRTSGQNPGLPTGSRAA